MKPLPEEPRFPNLNLFLLAVACSLPAALLAYVAYLHCHIIGLTGSYADIVQTVLRFWVVVNVFILSALILTILSCFAINHLSGRDHFGCKTPANSVFAYAYAISSTYVLPYAYHSTNKRGDHFCDLYLSFSYAEILHVYQALTKRHKLTYHFRTLSLPSHLGRRMPLLTRAGAKQLLREMHNVADANGESVQAQRAVLLYTFYPRYSNSAGLPAHQAFISRDIIRELLDLMGANPASAEIEAFYDATDVIALSADYLRATYTRIASEDEFVYLPISPA